MAKIAVSTLDDLSALRDEMLAETGGPLSAAVTPSPTSTVPEIHRSARRKRGLPRSQPDAVPLRPGVPVSM